MKTMQQIKFYNFVFHIVAMISYKYYCYWILQLLQNELNTHFYIKEPVNFELMLAVLNFLTSINFSPPSSNAGNIALKVIRDPYRCK